MDEKTIAKVAENEVSEIIVWGLQLGKGHFDEKHKYHEEKFTFKDVAKLSDIDLEKVPFKIKSINFGKFITKPSSSTLLWDFVIANRKNFPAVINFSQCIEQSSLIRYFDNQLHKNGITLRSSNHHFASYELYEKYIDADDEPSNWTIGESELFEFNKSRIGFDEFLLGEIV